MVSNILWEGSKPPTRLPNILTPLLYMGVHAIRSFVKVSLPLGGFEI